VSGRHIHRLAVVGVVASTGVVAGCGGTLTTDSFQWSVQLTQPEAEADLTVPFCPLVASRLAKRFTPDPNMVTFLAVENEDVFTFNQPTDALSGSGVSAPVALTFGPLMTFDIGPIGTVYDTNDALVLPFGTDVAGQAVTVTRTLVGGSRKSDSEVELTYDMTPSCTTATDADQTTCDCAATSFTWTFKGQ